MSNLFYFGDNEPASTQTGLHWIKPSSRQCFVYDGIKYVPVIAEGNSPVCRYPLTVFLNNRDISLIVDKYSFSHNNVLTSQVDTCSFSVFDYSEDLGLSTNQEVVVYYKDISGGATEKIFGGYIDNITLSNTAPGETNFNYQINCVDYSKGLQRRLAIDKEYEYKSAYYIIKDLIDTYYPGIYTYSNVNNIISVIYVYFNYNSVFDCIKKLSEITGYDWYISSTGDIHFFAEEKTSAPYSLTENIATTGQYKNLQIKKDKTQLRNKVYVQTGTYLSNLYTQEILADGTQVSFLLDYKPRAPISVYVDTGGGYVAHTLGIDYIDTSGYDFVVNYNEKVVKNLDHATLSAGHKFKATYKYEIPIRLYKQNSDSISSRALEELNDGLYEYIMPDNSQLKSLEHAYDIATQELINYSEEIISGSFTTRQTGYKAGQLLTVNLPSWGFDNKTYIIQSVSSVINQDSKFDYTVNFANENKNFTTFLSGLTEKNKNDSINSGTAINYQDTWVAKEVPTYNYTQSGMDYNTNNGCIYAALDTGSGIFKISKFDIATNTWSYLSNIPYTLDTVYGGAGSMCYGDGKLYIIHVANITGSPVRKFYSYDISSGNFTELASLGYYYGRLIYDGIGSVYFIGSNDVTTTMRKYSIANNTWENLGVLSFNTMEGVCFDNVSKIYCIGNTGALLRVYDITKTTWTTLNSSLSIRPFTFCTMCYKNSEIYILDFLNFPPYCYHKKYNIETGITTTLTHPYNNDYISNTDMLIVDNIIYAAYYDTDWRFKEYFT